MGDGRGKDDLGMSKQEILNRPKAAATTREFPPTDDELVLLDRLRAADAVGIDSLMLRVVNAGTDVNKPFVINAILDIIQHVRRAEQQIAAGVQNNSAALRKAAEDLAKLDQAVGKEIEVLEANVEVSVRRSTALAHYAADLADWLALPWMKRRKAPRPQRPAAGPQEKKDGAP